MTIIGEEMEERVAQIAQVIVDAIKADCVNMRGECYAVGNIDAMEIDGEFDAEAVAIAVIEALSSSPEAVTVMREALERIAWLCPKINVANQKLNQETVKQIEQMAYAALSKVTVV